MVKPASNVALFFALVTLLTGCPRSVSVPVTTDEQSPGMQSETAATVSYSGFKRRIIVAYNDDSDNQSTIVYSPTNRTVLRGASLMGWSFSENEGASWQRGGKLAPPPGWAVLWGDPALTSSGWLDGTVYLSNLALPDAKFPSSGYSGGVDNTVAGGACVFKSSDGGVSFQFSQCISDTHPIPGIPSSVNGHFYDGGSLASDFAGNLYAAYVDIDASQAVVYRSAGGTQPFVLLPPPFPTFYIASHPRIHLGPDGTLFVMAIAKQSFGPNPTYMLLASRFGNNTWSTPTLVAPALAYPTIDMGSTLLGSGLTVRTGPQFAFDVGARSLTLDDSIRFLVTQANSAGWLIIRGGSCDYALLSCGTNPGWTFGVETVSSRDVERLDVFDPAIVAFRGPGLGLEPRWQGSYLSRYGNSTTTVSLLRAPLGYLSGQPLSFPAVIATDQPVCPDLRGYWGDYDAQVIAHFDLDNARFTRFMTDSGQGCTQRWHFNSSFQHVQAISYDN